MRRISAAALLLWGVSLGGLSADPGPTSVETVPVVRVAKLVTEQPDPKLEKKKARWSVDKQLIPLRENRVVEIKDLPKDETATVRSTRPDIVEVEELGEGRFRLIGQQSGDCELVASVGETSLPSLPLSVKPWAARWGDGPGPLTFWGEVTSKRVERALARWLSTRTLLGAKIELTQEPSKEGTTYKVRATHAGAIPVEKTVDLSLMEYPSQGLEAARWLALSNHPERILSDGILFQRLVEGTPFRFMWHHRNDPDGPERYLVLQLTNPTSQSRRMRVLWSSYGPSPDEIHVGHTAALDYSVAAVQGAGEEWTLPPNSTRTIEVRRVKPGQTMSGMAYLSDLSGESAPVEVKVLATSSEVLPTTLAVRQDRGRTASGVFPAAIETTETHIVGGPFTYVEYGREPFVNDVAEGHPSYGNFGTIYRTRLMLKNPSDRLRDVTIGFAAAGGAARGVLTIDGDLFDLPMGPTGSGLPVKVVQMGPGEVRQVDVELFPQAGSNYPVRLVVQSEFDRLEKTSLEAIRPTRSLIP